MPHPEGGFYKRTYQSHLQMRQDLAGHEQFVVLPRPVCSAIHFLLPRNSKSMLHRIPSDEIWNFYAGGPLTIVEFDRDSLDMKLTLLGPDFRHGQKFQHVVRGGTIFGAFPSPESDYSFVGCVVSPAFEFGDFELFSREHVLEMLPARFHDMICYLTPE
eukprot:TRINITY_DN7485_c0_g1_i5.p1 TRINITY_DN7485_c0_g1~~TRINITY_DN7485_c0_g1_i5.p1  ORF type:complete len:159 (-),score=6.17 TRINITY_DN7485_c0_g1_i5:30-506(-)